LDETDAESAVADVADAFGTHVARKNRCRLGQCCEDRDLPAKYPGQPERHSVFFVVNDAKRTAEAATALREADPLWVFLVNAAVLAEFRSVDAGGVESGMTSVPPMISFWTDGCEQRGRGTRAGEDSPFLNEIQSRNKPRSIERVEATRRS
jgi:hypothetical protein